MTQRPTIVTIMENPLGCNKPELPYKFTNGDQDTVRSDKSTSQMKNYLVSVSLGHENNLNSFLLKFSSTHDAAIT